MVAGAKSGVELKAEQAEAAALIHSTMTSLLTSLAKLIDEGQDDLARATSPRSPAVSSRAAARRHCSRARRTGSSCSATSVVTGLPLAGQPTSDILQ